MQEPIDIAVIDPPAAPLPERQGDQVVTDLNLDYAAAGYTASSALGMAEALPDYIDDLTRREGAGLYERMATDAQVFGDTGALRRAILASGWRLTLPAGHEDDSRAKQLLAFCQSALSELETPLPEIMDDLLWSIGLGSRVQHLVWRQDGRWLLPHYAKTILRNDYAYLVDNRGRLMGVEAMLAGRMDQVIQRGPIADVTRLSNVLPRNRILHMKWGASGFDPRGMAQYRAVYDPWYQKKQAIVERARFLAQMAGGAVVIELPEKAILAPRRNPDGSPVLGPGGQPVMEDPSDSALLAGQRYKNGALLVLKGGAKASLMAAASGGEAFEKTIRQCNEEISHGILHQALATNEGRHQSRAATGSHKDIFDLLVEDGESRCSATIRRDLLRGLVFYNFGARALPLTPTLHLSAAEEADIEGLTSAWSGVGYRIAPEHLREVDEKLGLSQRATQSVAVGATEKPPASGPHPSDQDT